MDDYKKLSREWGSKARKEEGRARKHRLDQVPDESDEISQPIGIHKKKDTKKWCKGKVGRPHQTKCLLASELKNSNHWPLYEKMHMHHQSRWRYLVCQKCLKVLDIWYGNKKQKPDWVTK